MDIDEQLMDIPTMESQAELTLPSANFANIVSQLKLFGDTLDIQCNEEQILLFSNSVDSGKMTVSIPMDDLQAFSINEGADLKISFGLTSLHNICMYHKICKNIDIKWIENFPIQLTYIIEENIAKMTFYLAPKLSDD
jgi:proliferating cell nuclear antigen